MFNKKLIFSPGPLPYNKKIKIDFSHRSSKFEDLYEDVKSKLKIKFNLVGRDLLFIQGSGTASVECVISSLVNKSKKILILVNGNFGKNMSEILLKYGSKRNIKIVDNITKCQELLKINNYDMFFSVQFETSRSIYNDLERCLEYCSKKNILSVIDCISSMGYYELPNADIICSSSSKILGGLPSMGIIIYDRLIYSLLHECKANTYYLDIKRYLDYDETSRTPHTSLLPQFISLNNEINNSITPFQIQNNCKYFENFPKAIGEDVAPVISLRFFGDVEKFKKQILEEYNIELYYNNYMKNYFQISMFSYKDEKVYKKLSKILWKEMHG